MCPDKSKFISSKVTFKELDEDHLDNFRKDRLIAYYKQQLEKLTAAYDEK